MAGADVAIRGVLLVFEQRDVADQQRQQQAREARRHVLQQPRSQREPRPHEQRCLPSGEHREVVGVVDGDRAVDGLAARREKAVVGRGRQRWLGPLQPAAHANAVTRGGVDAREDAHSDRALRAASDGRCAGAVVDDGVDVEHEFAAFVGGDVVDEHAFDHADPRRRRQRGSDGIVASSGSSTSDGGGGDDNDDEGGAAGGRNGGGHSDDGGSDADECERKHRQQRQRGVQPDRRTDQRSNEENDDGETGQHEEWGARCEWKISREFRALAWRPQPSRAATHRCGPARFSSGRR